ncbi:SCO7613 C-terminal domain-containing membrane protein [Pedococcus sp. NPDC057267]|uniref:SCO7613 C-terminal domain-containing membrane protein n=1 Tax=Pedococcus sp. NPDC057267 TaxID=3346077 RepID=UPI003627182F
MASIPCPSCGTELPPSPQQCPRCGVRLTGPDAVRLWEVDQALARLSSERRALLAALSAPAPGATATTPGVVFAGAPQGAEPLPPAEAPRPPHRSWTTQQTLLAVGVLLVLVAGSIALAVAWFVIGRYGQVLVMAGLTALACQASLVLSRRHLPSSAEALAVVAGGLLLLDASAARRFGLAGLDGVDVHAYTAVSGLLVALVLAALHRRDRRVAAFGVLSLTAASVAWGAVVTVPAQALPTAVLALLGAPLFALLHLALPPTLGVVRRAATGPAAGWLVVGAALATAIAADVEPGDLRTNALLADALLLAVAALGALVVARVVRERSAGLGSRAAVRADWAQRWLTGDWRAVGVLAAVASGTAPVAVLSLSVQLAPVAAAALGVLLAAVVVAVVAVRPLRSRVGQLWLEAEVTAVLVAAFLATVVHASQPAQACVLAAAAVAATAVAVVRHPWRALASGVAAACAVGATWLTADLVDEATAVVAVAAVGLGLVAAALVRPRRAEEVPLGTVGAIALVAALADAVTQGLDRPVVVAVLACATVAGVGTAVLRPTLRPAATAVAVVTGTGLAREVGLLVSSYAEWASLALTALVLAGLTAWRRLRPEEPVLGGFAIVVGVLALALGLDRDLPHSTAAAAFLYALAALGTSVPASRRPVVLVGVAAATTASWVELLHADVTTLEAYTLPPALLLLAAGLWSAQLLGRRSWLVAGPGLAVGLLPSALFTAVDDGLLRPLLAVTVAVVVLVVGAWRRWQALVVLGAAAAVVVGITQLGPYAVHLPRFLTLGTLGVALLAIGARYEQRRANARHAISWLASLS